MIYFDLFTSLFKSIFCLFVHFVHFKSDIIQLFKALLKDDTYILMYFSEMGDLKRFFVKSSLFPNSRPLHVKSDCGATCAFVLCSLLIRASDSETHGSSFKSWHQQTFFHFLSNMVFLSCKRFFFKFSFVFPS